MNRFKSLIVNLEARTAAFQRGMADANKHLGVLSGSIKTVGRAFSFMLPAIGIAGLAALQRQAILSGDAIAKTADKIGVTTAALQELRFAGELAGVEISGMDKSLEMLGRRVGEAADGTGELLPILRDNNIALRDGNGQLRTQDAILNDLADAIQKAHSQQEKLNIANRAFGRAGASMVNMLKDGSAGLDRVRQRARDLGLVLDDRMLRATEAANDQLTIMGKIIGVNLQRGFLALTPLIIRFGEAFAQAAPYIARFMDELMPDELAGETELERRLTHAREQLALWEKMASRRTADSTDRARVQRWQAEVAALDSLLTKRQEERRLIETRIQSIRDAGTEETGIAKLIAKEWDAYQKQVLKGDVEAVLRRQAEAAKDEARARQLAAGWLPDETTLTDALTASLERRREVLRETADAEAQRRRHAAGWLPAETEHVDALTAAWQRDHDAIQETQRQAESVGRTIAGSLAAGIVNGQRMSEVFENITKRLVQMALEAAIFRAIMGGYNGGGPSVSATLASAKGNAFSGGRVVPMARGAVVSGPVMGPMALMGEAGPEAVMPLQRGADGKLGVAATAPQVQIINMTGQGARVERSNGGRSLRVIVGEMVADEVRRGGSLDSALRQRYGLRPAVAGR